MDEEVKDFFFNLTPVQLADVLERYSEKFGDDKAQYALETYPRWKSGRRQMSGLVAGRLFDLLPPIMPMDLKLRIVEGLWENQGPDQTQYVLVPSSFDADQCFDFIGSRLFDYVEAQSISEDLKRRFNWLAGEDASVAEQLFRHARAVQFKVRQRIATAIMARATTDAERNADVINTVVSTITVGKHSVSVKRSRWVDEPRVVTFAEFTRGGAKAHVSADSDSVLGWTILLIGVGMIIYFVAI